MNRVFVVQENPNLDYGPAESYGEVVFITAEEFRPIAGSIRNDYILTDIDRRMAEFDPDNDWLILTGNPMIMGYSFHLALMKTGSVKCLQWDRRSAEYREHIFKA
jgi:hypothetical protein